MVRRKLLVLLSSSLLLGACGQESSTYSILPTKDIFSQSTSTVSNKLDILWVIDNSGSMEDDQIALANNLQSFMAGFIQKGYDFNIGVTTTDAYKSDFISTSPQLSQLVDGNPNTGASGYRILQSTTPDLQNVFMKNVLQGINGSGDERAFQSFRAVLNNPLNSGFRRPNAFLSVIIVSDEDDFSHDGTQHLDRQYTNPALHTIPYYLSYLDTLTNVQNGVRRYSVSAIGIFDQACINHGPFAQLADRYAALVDATHGIKGSLCDNFGTTLQTIQANIAELSTQFYLTRQPKAGTIVVNVNGGSVPESSANGWTYNATANSVIFHGTAIPAEGATIYVNYDPTTIL